METLQPEPVGYQALDSLRIEKGYRYFGTDLTASDTPFDSGLAFAVAKDKWPELDREPPTMLRTLLVGGEEYLTLYGGEAVHHEGEVIGRVRSAAYGFTVKRNVALAKIPSELGEGTEVAVDVMGDLVPAVVSKTDLV
jgi:glycine cleavage system aminomethyltransferase T